jgi:hypothetical protein
MDGVVTRPNENTVVLEMEGGSLTFQASEVDRIEANAKRGTFQNPMARKHEDELNRRTGLTAAQREELRALMEPLKSEDETEVNRAKKAILKKAETLDLFRFFQSSLTVSGLYAPDVLELMEKCYPDRALPVLREYAQNIEPVTRAKALELLAAHKDKDDLELVARGAVDPDPEVQVAALKALNELAGRRATPVYLLGLGSSNARVRATALAVLSAQWKDVPGAPLNAAPAAWPTFWDSQAASVADALDPKALRPLTATETGKVILYHNE